MSTKKNRIYSIDVLKGICILYMIVDHWRDHLSRMGQEVLGAANPMHVNAGNLEYADTALFWIRLVGNGFVPATFIFLAGASCYLWHMRRGQDVSICKHLFQRGAMLAVLNCLLFFHAPFSPGGSITLHVLWPTGIGMIFLGFMAKWPKPLLWATALISILGQNIFENIAIPLPYLDTLWIMAFIAAPVPLPWGAEVFNLWPFMPWFGVLLLGYLSGPIFTLGRQSIGVWAKLSIFCLSAFLVLRISGIYGDPTQWQLYDSIAKTLGALITVSKYPPSTQCLLLGLGMTYFFLALFERYQVKSSWLIYYGSMPLFFYITHLVCIRIIKFIIMRLPEPVMDTIKGPLFSLSSLVIGTAALAFIIFILAEIYKKIMQLLMQKKRAATTN